jgi:hypothetical protein
MDAPLVTITLSGAPTIAVSRDPSSAAPEAIDATPFSFQWTGRHDGGPLPQPPDSGHYALALSALAEAKAAMDAHFAREAAAATAAAAAAAAGAAAAAAAADAADAPAAEAGPAAPHKKQKTEGAGGAQ